MKRLLDLGWTLQSALASTVQVKMIQNTFLFVVTLLTMCGVLFVAAAGIHHDYTTVYTLLQRWWNLEHRNEVQKLLIKFLPVIVMWNLQRYRCTEKYGAKQSNTIRVKFLILKDFNYLLNTTYPYIQWPNNQNILIGTVASCNHEIMIKEVKWEKPNQPFLKLNTNGSALDNHGKIERGGIVRDHRGNMIYTLTIPQGIGTNNQVEIQAASHGLDWCIQHGYKKIHLEVDLELLIY